MDSTLLTNLHYFHLLLQMFACIDAFTSDFHILSFGSDIDCSLSFLFLTSSVFAQMMSENGVRKLLWVAGNGEGANKKRVDLPLERMEKNQITRQRGIIKSHG